MSFQAQQYESFSKGDKFKSDVIVFTLRLYEKFYQHLLWHRRMLIIRTKYNIVKDLEIWEIDFVW